MKHRIIFGFLILGILLFAIIILVGTSLYPSNNYTQKAETKLNFIVLRDVPEEINIEQVCCQGSYVFSEQSFSNVQTYYGERSLWLKLEQPLKSGIIKLSPILDDVTLFVKEPNTEKWKQTRSGDSIPVNSRAMKSPFMALPLIDHAVGSSIFIRIVQPSLVSVNVEIWPQEDFKVMESVDALATAFLVGIVIAIITYNLFLTIFISDSAYILNALTISALLFQALYLSGYGVLYIWPQWFEWSNVINYMSMFCAVTFGSAFLWIFMRTKNEPARNGWPLMLAPTLAIFALISTTVLPYWWVLLILLLSAGILLINSFIFAFMRAMKGDHQAKIILFPMILAVIPGLGFVAADKLFGFKLQILGDNLLETTLSVEAILFSLALAARIKAIENETQQVSKRLIALTNENAAKVITAQDKERQRLAKELHDGVTQDFMVVLGNLKKLVQRDPPEGWKAIIENLISSATTAIDELRRISRDMHPASIAHLGILKALEALIENFQSSNNIKASFEFLFDENKLTPEAKLHIYRIVQECLTNIDRHADATHVDVTMTENDGGYELKIQDDGKGIENPDISSGLGLKSIEERVRSLGGQWHLSSSSLGGVLAEVKFPSSSREMKPNV